MCLALFLFIVCRNTVLVILISILHLRQFPMVLTISIIFSLRFSITSCISQLFVGVVFAGMNLFIKILDCFLELGIFFIQHFHNLEIIYKFQELLLKITYIVVIKFSSPSTFAYGCLRSQDNSKSDFPSEPIAARSLLRKGLQFVNFHLPPERLIDLTQLIP